MNRDSAGYLLIEALVALAIVSVGAALAARVTKKARVALCVTNLVTRDAAISAAAIASIDQLIEGRAVLGIGAGHSGTKNLGRNSSTAKELGQGVTEGVAPAQSTRGPQRGRAMAS